MKNRSLFFRAVIFLLMTGNSLAFAGWEIISPNPKLMDVQIMGDTWFAIEYHGASSSDYFLISENNGHRWDTLSDFSSVFRIRVHKDKILVRGIYKGTLGFYLSSDTAKTWQKFTWLYDVSALDMLMNDTAIFFFVSKSSSVSSPVYRSLDTGKTWHPLPIEAGDVNWNGNVQGINFGVHGKTIGVFLNAAGFHISKDGGDTWTKCMDGLPDLDIDYGPLSVMPEGFLVRYPDGWYVFNGTGWEKKKYVSVYYDDFHEEWRIQETNIPRPYVGAYRLPYVFAVDGDAGGYLYYSIDNGEKWFMFSVPGTEFTSVFKGSLVISGNYVYAAFNTGFARRSLSEAINPVVEEDEKEEEEFPVSPEELENLLGMLGPDAFEDLLEEMGIDAEELSHEEMQDFLEDYIEDNGMTDLFGNSQPGSCSYMGMPLWSMNVANLKLFVRDIIFRKKGIGPEVKLAMNYIHGADSAKGIFGRHWRFEYETFLMQEDSAVTLTTGTGAVFVFSENKAVVTGATAFSIPCLKHDQYKLHWTGTTWRVEKGLGYETLNFDAAGGNLFLLKSVEDAYGKKLNLTYDAGNKPVLLTDGSGREYGLTYSNNLCDSLKLPDGRFAVFSYNDRGMLISSADFVGVETHYAYDAIRNIQSVDIAGKITNFHYDYAADTLGKISAVIDPEGRQINYFSILVDSSVRLTNVVYPGNKMVSYQTCDGFVTSITNMGGEAKKIFYNGEGKPDSLVWYDGSSVVLTYDARGDLVSRRDRTGKVTTYEYNETRRLLREKSHEGETRVEYSYNARNQLETITLPGNLITAYAYDDNGALASVTDPEGNVYVFGRDEYGNMTSYTNPLGHTMNFLFGDKGFFPVGSTDFKGNHYDLAYDSNGRLTGITMPDGNKRTFLYDCCTQTGITDENGHTVSVIRDATSRILEKTTAEGISLPIRYDENGFISGFTTVYGSQKNLSYNPRGLLTLVSDEEGNIRYAYNEKGQPVSVMDKKGNETRLTYTDAGDLSAITDAAGQKTRFAFDEDGKLVSFTNARNQATTFIYDAAGNPVEKRLNGTSYATYEYDNQKRIMAYTDSSGTTAYTRNAMGFVTKITYSRGLSVDFEYDANGNTTGITYPDGMKVTNTPDVMNRIENVSWGAASISFEYDAAGGLLAETRSNGTHTYYAYNKDKVLTEVEHTGADTVFAGEYITLEEGVITGMQVRFVPPVSVIPVRLTNMNSNSLNQIDQSFINQMSLPHDADGNLTAFIEKGVWRMTASYSHDNLVAAIKTSGKNTAVSYDAMRYPRKMASGGVTAYLYYDHKGRLLFETDEEGNPTIHYVYRGKRLVASQNTGGEVCFYHYSRNGNTLAVTGSDGSVLNAYAYSAHGEVIGKEELTDNRFTFLGAFGAIRFDDKYILTGARVYSAQMGRYLQRDPLGMITGTNPYLYASNNPVSGLDPLGLDDQNEAVNSQALDPSIDNAYSTAGGTANPYADDLPGRESDWDIYGSALSKTAEEFFNHPVADFIPDAIGNPVAYAKAIQHLSNKEYGKALWQFVPFNNSMEYAADYYESKKEYFDPAKFSGLGIFGEFNNQKTFTCDL